MDIYDILLLLFYLVVYVLLLGGKALKLVYVYSIQILVLNCDYLS
jgi:hypothetical protein